MTDSNGQAVKIYDGRGGIMQLDRSEARQESWSSLISGVGGVTNARLESRILSSNKRTDEELRHLYDHDGLARRVCETPSKDMFRRGVLVDVENNETLSDDLTDRVQTLKTGQRFTTAMAYQRAMGAAGIVMRIDDGRPWGASVAEDKIKAIRWIRTYDRRALKVKRWNEDINSDKFGEAALFELHTTRRDTKTHQKTEIHPDRVIWFADDSDETDEQDCTSLLSRAYDSVRDWGYSWSAISEMLDQTAIPVWKMAFMRQLVGAEGEAAATKRFEMATLAKSIARAIVIDKEHEEFEWRTLSLGGIPDTMAMMLSRLSADTGLPITKLAGRSPAGLNATGESDERNYYDDIQADRTQSMVPALERFIRLLMLEQEGVNAEEPPVWKVDFPPLRTPSETEMRENELKAAQAYRLLVDGEITTEDEVRTAIGPNGAIQSIELDEEAFEQMQAEPDIQDLPPPVVPDDEPEDEPDDKKDSILDRFKVDKDGVVVIHSGGKDIEVAS